MRCGRTVVLVPAISLSGPRGICGAPRLISPSLLSQTWSRESNGDGVGIHVRDYTLHHRLL